MQNLNILQTFPHTRGRRIRGSAAMRDLVRETILHTNDLILPIFVEEEIDDRVPIGALPGVFRESETSLKTAVKEAWDLGIKAVILFGISHKKNHTGSDAFTDGGLISRMIQTAKDTCPEMVVISDTCFCEYTDHGHCGPLEPCGDVDNDATLENLAKQAVTAARAGADIIAPSGMMDGMVQAIRGGLDSEGFTKTAIMAYSAKFASCFYGPFRDAAGCALGGSEQGLSDRKTYQMDPANTNEALRETAMDINEGADMVMVKPGLPYLDILQHIKETFQMPTYVYNVSGEYAMIKHASAAGALDHDTAMMEMLLSFKRAGADGILTYFACDAAKLLRENA